MPAAREATPAARLPPSPSESLLIPRPCGPQYVREAVYVKCLRRRRRLPQTEGTAGERATACVPRVEVRESMARMTQPSDHTSACIQPPAPSEHPRQIAALRAVCVRLCAAGGGVRGQRLRAQSCCAPPSSRSRLKQKPIKGFDPRAFPSPVRLCAAAPQRTAFPRQHRKRFSVYLPYLKGKVCRCCQTGKIYSCCSGGEEKPLGRGGLRFVREKGRRSRPVQRRTAGQRGRR